MKDRQWCHVLDFLEFPKVDGDVLLAERGMPRCFGGKTSIQNELFSLFDIFGENQSTKKTIWSSPNSPSMVVIRLTDRRNNWRNSRERSRETNDLWAFVVVPTGYFSSRQPLMCCPCWDWHSLFAVYCCLVFTLFQSKSIIMLGRCAFTAAARRLPAATATTTTTSVRCFGAQKSFVRERSMSAMLLILVYVWFLTRSLRFWLIIFCSFFVCLLLFRWCWIFCILPVISLACWNDDGDKMK